MSLLGGLAERGFCKRSARIAPSMTSLEVNFTALDSMLFFSLKETPLGFSKKWFGAGFAWFKFWRFLTIFPNFESRSVCFSSQFSLLNIKLRL